jgi:hypothetical protein
MTVRHASGGGIRRYARPRVLVMLPLGFSSGLQFF